MVATFLFFSTNLLSVVSPSQASVTRGIFSGQSPEEHGEEIDDVIDEVGFDGVEGDGGPFQGCFGNPRLPSEKCLRG